MLRNNLRRRRGARVVVSSFLVLTLTLAATAQDSSPDGRVKGYVPPPKNLELVGDHWTPYTPPVPPEGSQVHVIERGDTLWDLAGQYYGDAYLWPVIWDANRYVTYSHWIYPGDPLVIPPQPTLVGETGVEGVVPVPPAEPTETVEVVPEPTGPILVPVAAPGEMICASRLLERFDPSPLTIAGRDEPEKELQATGDIVYLSAGQDMGIEPGAEYSVVHQSAELAHPDDGRFQAIYMSRLGKIRVLAVHEDSSTAEISFACDAMVVGDYLVPFRENPVPMVEKVSLMELATPYPGRVNGVVVVTDDPRATVAGAGDLVGIDLGSGAGLTAGDRVLFWRPAEGTTVRKVVAHGVVLSATGGGSIVKVIESREAIVVGMRAEVL
ncbi:MAG: LysM peptidoglycan-binding domain-containing protein [Acidobacteriota bacterium]|nr:LysM peptidoglycan-binding domain-containing protein [Acidobacteriota bacterium]